MSIHTEQFILHPEQFDIRISLVNVDGIDNGLFFVGYSCGDAPGAEIIDSLLEPDSPVIRVPGWKKEQMGPMSAEIPFRAQIIQMPSAPDLGDDSWDLPFYD
jgi:hypothetical protein